jgi:maltooligosyltrehalose trehalohydrolase
MPFGAEFVAQSSVRFKLWAPGASEVKLDLTHANGKRTLAPMGASGEGWYALTLDGVQDGARYTFRIDDRIDVPDPASRYNPQDVHAASAVVDPQAFDWPDGGWQGRPWEEAVVYELHLGTFTPAGTFNSAIDRLDYLARLGVTAIEIMPVADFPGRRNWGYDGVLPFAPDAAYGSPQDLKSLIAAAHARGLMILLDVVYNHFGPEGNYLHVYAPQFFNPAHKTPWGAAINFDGEHARVVRDFFIHNALYWLEEFNFDGLRLDAIHAIADDSRPDIVDELTRAVHDSAFSRPMHLVLENDRNEARRLTREQDRPRYANAQWNDDIHHALHVLATGEKDGYYRDYAQRPLWWLGRALAEGFAYQGETSMHREGEKRGEVSSGLPPVAFVNFLQNHDQIGNRALGERLSALTTPAQLRLATICLLLAPAIPLIFMGEEFATEASFLFFCDFGPELAPKVVEGRRAEFASFERFRTPQAQAAIPDPGAEQTFLASKLDWAELVQPVHREMHTLYVELLDVRRRRIVPHLTGMHHAAKFSAEGSALAVDWTLGDGSRLYLQANFSGADWTDVPDVPGEVIFPFHAHVSDPILGPWQARWTLEGTGN